MKIICILLISLLSIGCEKDFSDYYSYDPPEFVNDGLDTGKLEDVGLDSQMLAKAIGRIYSNKYDQVHSMLIYKDGFLVFEEYMEGNKYKWDGPNHYGERIQWDCMSSNYVGQINYSKTINPGNIFSQKVRTLATQVHNIKKGQLPVHFRTGRCPLFKVFVSGIFR